MSQARETMDGGGAPLPDAPANERREEILATATRLFSEVGYNAVGIRMIADKVGIKTSTLYHYFSSKEEILYHIALRATTDFIDSHTHIFAQHEDDPAGLLRAMVRSYVVYFYENRLAQKVAERELGALSPDHYSELRRRQRDYLDRVIAVIENGVRAEVLHVERPAIVARAFLDMLNHFNRWFTPRPNLEVTDLADLYAVIVVEQLLGADPEVPAGRASRSAARSAVKLVR